MSTNKKEIAEVVELAMSDITSRLTMIENNVASILSIVQGLQSNKKAPAKTTKTASGTKTTKTETKDTTSKTSSKPADKKTEVSPMMSVWFKKNFAKNEKFRKEFLENADVEKLVSAGEFTDDTDKDNLKKVWTSFTSHGKEKAPKIKAIPEIQELYKKYKDQHEKLKG